MSDFFLEAATFVGQYRHVLLILDDFPTLLVSERFFERYRQLSSPNIQVIMTTVRSGLEEMLGVDQIVELDIGSYGISIRNVPSTKEANHGIFKSRKIKCAEKSLAS